MWEQGPWYLLPQHLEQYVALDGDGDDGGSGGESP